MNADRHTAGLNVYRVGGAVRDARLGWPVVDRDWVVVGTTPEVMLERGFKPVGRDFPVFLHPLSHEEYALARTERKAGHGYTGFVVHASPEVTLEEDLERRDLTINAMAEAPDGTLVDPFHGRRDLEARLLRHVSPAFVEDPLRVLRTARFLARYRGLGFAVADETRLLMRRLAESGELEHLAAERIWQETEKALGEPQPQAYFGCLEDCAALTLLMPELAADRTALHEALERLMAVPDAPPWTLTQWRWARLVEHLDEATREALHDRLKVPNAYRDLARQVALSRTLWLTGAPLDATRTLDWLNAIDGWRRSERVPALLALFGGEAPALAERLERAWRAAARIEPRNLLDEGFRGGELGAELARRRQAAIAEALS
ncbi:polynucleotide adenylyltransferase [Halomonas sp. HP20-15]|uniref:polynucleotide adenylyltransferase n=1 Tax=Halomonas sp. HP20-15 TaxID=3085901 RepID=UPI002981355D|nr:polynucleotide adenylyltransferase [Halomonas sp. HP20-15]MDW5378764.1 polynucleotide adenylyltransferase [Halomonas sp. HP20-15]